MKNTSGKSWSKLSMGEKFEIGWNQLAPESFQNKLELEYQFHPDRKWRFDVAIIEPVRIGIEFDGFGHSHSAPWQKRRDKEKQNAAAALGWRVFRYESGMLSMVRLPTLISEIIDAVSPEGSQFCKSCGSIYVPDQDITVIDNDIDIFEEESESGGLQETQPIVKRETKKTTSLPIGKSPYDSQGVQRKVGKLRRVRSQSSLQA